MKSLYFTDNTQQFYIGHPTIENFFCQGMRGRGKTTVFLKQAVDRAVKDVMSSTGNQTHKFHFMRRTDTQMEEVLAKGLFNGVLKVPEYKEVFQGFTESKIFNKEIILKKPETNEQISIGYVDTLNNTKGKAVEDSDCVIFDEYVEPQRGLYKGGQNGVFEPELFGRFDDTVFRKRKRYVVLLGNFDSPTNPYNEYFQIPYGCQKFTDKSRKLYYYVDTEPAAIEERNNTSVGTLWKNTRYGNYANGLNALGEVNTNLICNKVSEAQHVYNINVSNVKLTIWESSNGVWYVHDNYKFDITQPIFTVFSKDMAVNSFFINYNSTFLQLCKLKFGTGKVRFNNQKTATLFNLVISLTQ